MSKPIDRSVLARALALTIRNLRARTGIAQETLALEAGIPRAHVGRLEGGMIGNPTLETVFKLLPPLDISFVQFAQEFERQLRRRKEAPT
jgi:transcriptional regulator with XRE-family HTH domain